MKGLLTLVVAALFAAGCSNGSVASEPAVIDFNVTDKTASEVVMVVRNDIRNISLDQDGKGQIVLEGYEAAYARIFYGMDFKWVYFEKGDRAVVSFKGKDFKGSFEFEGEKAQAVDYLNTIKLTALPDGLACKSQHTYKSDFLSLNHRCFKSRLGCYSVAFNLQMSRSVGGEGHVVLGKRIRE